MRATWRLGQPVRIEGGRHPPGVPRHWTVVAWYKTTVQEPDGQGGTRAREVVERITIRPKQKTTLEAICEVHLEHQRKFEAEIGRVEDCGWTAMPR